MGNINEDPSTVLNSDSVNRLIYSIVFVANSNAVVIVLAVCGWQWVTLEIVPLFSFTQQVN